MEKIRRLILVGLIISFIANAGFMLFGGLITMHFTVCIMLLVVAYTNRVFLFKAKPKYNDYIGGYFAGPKVAERMSKRSPAKRNSLDHPEKS